MSEQTGLIHYDKMCRAIAECAEVDEVKDIRDKAMAMEAYAKQAMNTEAERQAINIRLRAERKAGEMLKEMERSPRANGGMTKVAVQGALPPSEANQRICRFGSVHAAPNRKTHYNRLKSAPHRSQNQHSVHAEPKAISEFQQGYRFTLDQ